MATSNTILKDVVAYVDVWASEKNANYSKPFVQQLQEMGAQVSKTFNKQVTHVIFSFGHPATWSKAKKNNVRLVSVLWVGRCYDDGVRADEELYPALNDESNPVLKNKKHRCMQPKDPPSRTPENDRRMKKKLDKMMKDLAPKQPMVTDVSPYPPIFIDEENGIIYSPSLKRSEYMAKRLKDMKEKREKLLSTASQIVESCSPTGLKPSIGSTPSVLKLKYDESDDDSSADVAEPGYSPDKEEGRTQVDVSAPEHLEHMKSTEKPWLSPCRDVPKRITSPLKCPDFTDEDFTSQTKSRRSSARKKSPGKNKYVGLLESPCQDERSDNPKNVQKAKRRSEITSSSPSPSKSEKGKGKVKAAKSFTETKTHFFPDTMNSASCLSPPATVGHAVVEPSKETPTPLQKIPKRARPSISAMVRSITVSGIKSVASCSTDGDDNVFEDYFSPANHHKKSQKSLLPNLPVEKDIKIPFELGSAANKRKPRRSESVASETNSKKKRKLEESQRGKSPKQQSDASSVPQSQPQQDVNESPPASNNPGANKTLIAERRRQSTLSFTSTNTTPGEAVTLRRASTSAQQTLVLEANTVSDRSQTFESRGNECTVSAGSTEIPSEGEENLNEQVSLNLQKMVNKAKVMRTLVMTSMPTEKQQTVSQVVETLGGFSVVDRVSESTTHVVSGSNRRTLNILLGIARGCWILSFEWILWCLEQRQWIPEEPYELSDQFPAAQICRLQRHLSAGEHQQDLFQGLPAIFVSPQAQPPAQSLVELIQLCGGTVCKTVRQAGICIGKYNGRRPEGTKVLSEQWVLDCITSLKQLSYDNYDFE